MSGFAIDLFAKISAVAESDPNRLALIEGEKIFTYRQLKQFIEVILGDMSVANVPSGSRVGIFLPNSIEAYGAIYAAAIFGVTYVPLPVDDPPARLKELFEIAELSCVLCGASFSESLGDILGSMDECLRPDVIVVDVDRLGDDSVGAVRAVRAVERRLESRVPLYMLFTSGSTGTPKGVLIDDENVENFVCWAVEYFKVCQADVFFGHPRLTFDLSVFSLFVPFLSGAAVQIVRPGLEQMYPGSVLQQGVTIGLTTPRITGLMKEAGQLSHEAYPSLRHMIFCGEQLLASQAQAWLSTHSRIEIHNVYGPTECTVACTVHTVDRTKPIEDPVSIGRPIPNMGLAFLDSGGVPIDGEAEGDLVIFGIGVSAKGYWRHQSDRFFVHSHLGLCFRTGDLSRRDRSGSYFWKARLDHQLKVRGYRVELGEVEYRLAQHQAVLDIVCLYSQHRDGLVVAVKFTPDIDVGGGIAELKKIADVHLPHYMRPVEYFALDQFPRDRNGKADRNRIAEDIFRSRR